MNWVLAIVVAWFAVATVAAVLIGRGIRVADAKAATARAAASSRAAETFPGDAVTAERVDAPDAAPSGHALGRPSGHRRPARTVR